MFGGLFFFYRTVLNCTILLLLISSTQKTNAQIIKQQVGHIKFVERDGLPSCETYDVMQDSKGYLWIGTDKGVVKYDGISFEVFTTENGLTDNAIFIIKEDYQGRIWFVTYNRKICYYYNGKFHAYKYNNLIKSAIPDGYLGNIITYFHIDSNNTLSIETMGHTNQIQITEEGKLTIEKSASKLRINQLFRNQESINNLIDNLSPYLKGKYNLQKVVESFHGETLHIKLLGSKILVGSSNGLNIFNAKTAHHEKKLLQNYYITGFCIDFEGHIWCTTLHNGLVYIPNSNLHEYDLSKELIQNQISGIVPQESKICVVYRNVKYEYGYTTYIYETSKGLINKNLKIYYDKIPSIEKPKGIKLESGIPIYPFSDPVYSACLVTDSQYISAEIRLLKTIVKKNVSFQVIDVQKVPRVFRVFNDMSGNTWIGTIEGLYKKRKKGHKPNKNSLPSIFSRVRVQDINQTLDSTLIIATRGNGVYFWKGKDITHYSEKNGLISNTLNSVWHDNINDNIWFATNKGIMGIKYDSKTKLINVIKTFKEDEGFTTPDILQVYGVKDTMFYISKQSFGFISNIQNHQPVINKPSINFDSLIVNNHNIYNWRDTEFKHHENNIQFHFHSIAFKASKSLKYKYKLQGLDSNWREGQQRQIDYNSLPPGKYTFSTKAVNAYGMESEQIDIKLTIRKAFWMTAAFRLLILVLVLVLFIMIIKKIINHYNYKLEIERTINELKIKSLQTKMNPHFIFNCLNSIQNYILKNEKEEAQNFLTDFSRLIRLVLQHSDSVNITLDNELEILRIYVNLERNRLRSKFKYEEYIDPKIDTERCILPSLLIQPFIENAIWHGEIHEISNGEINLHIILKNNRLFFTIKDNGIGVTFAQAKKKRNNHISYATNIAQKRIELISKLSSQLSSIHVTEAYLDEETSKKHGTVVSFSIPYETS